MASSVINFNLAAQPTITASNVNCTITDVDFTNPSAVTWDFTPNSTNQNPNGSNVTTQFVNIDRYDIVAGTNTYTGFHNVSFSGGILPEIQTNLTAIAPDTFNICQGDYASFNSLYPADNYNWNFNGAIPNPGSVDNIFAQFNTAGTFLITLNMTTDCCGTTPNDSVWLYVSPLPTPTGSGNVTYCEGGTATLTLNGLIATDSVVWNPTNNLVVTGQNTVVVNPNITTTYTATVYSVTQIGNQTIVSCPEPVIFDVTVNSNPSVAYNVTDVVCTADGSVTANVTPAGTYSYTWSNGGTTSTINGLTSDIYYLTVTNTVTGCVLNDSVFVNPSPTAPTLYVQNVTVPCDGQATGEITVNTLGGTPTYNYSWDNGAIGSTLSNINAGTYTVTVTDGAGCSDDLIYELPENTIDTVIATVNTPICYGDSAVFEIVGDDGSTLTYNFNGGANQTLLFTQDTMYVTLYNLTADTTLNLISIANANCSENIGTSTTVQVINSSNISITNNGPICDGTDAEFTITGDVGATVYYHINTGGSQSTVLTTGTSLIIDISPSSNSTIYLDSMTTGLCTFPLDDSSVVEWHPLPTLNFVNNGPICSGDDAIFYLTGTTDDTLSYDIGSGTQTIALEGNNNDSIFVSNATADITVNFISITNGYCVTALNQASTITVNPNPTFTVASTDPTTCGGTDGFITLSGLSPNTNYNVSYDSTVTVGPIALTSDAAGEIVITGLNDGDYSNFTVELNGCSTTDPQTITLTEPTGQAVDAGQDVTICTGDMVTLNGSGVVSYVWDNGVDNGVPFAPTSTTTYTVTGTDVNGCTNTDQVTVTVNPLPNVDAGAAQTVCDGTSITLSGSGATSYIWDNGVVNGVSFTPLATTTYTVTGTDANGCVNTDQVTVTVNPMPIIDFTLDTNSGCYPLTVNFTDNTTPFGINCVWDFGNGTTANTCGNTSYTYTQAGNYDVTYTVTYPGNCTSSLTYSSVLVEEVPQAIFNVDNAQLTIENTEIEFINNSINANTYQWDFGDNSANSGLTNPIHTYPEIGNSVYLVTLVASNDAGCTDTAQQTIYVNDVIIYYVPNVFTPDGDAFNQTFQPVFTSGYDPYDYHLMIFNRWGELVFESYNADYGWNGRYGADGDLVQDGVYVWKINFKETMSDKKHEAIGHVTILR
ncbi:MAG TPA: PKD domain-containing protein [Crocinitomix sp.]|nr:PKD domain-containing protein [Crocinitomix sp.]